MNIDQFLEHQRVIYKEASDIMGRKSSDYDGNDEIFANIRRMAGQFQVNPATVILLLAQKHWDALCRAAAGHTDSAKHERVRDVINYLCMVDALWSEDETQ